MRCPVRFPAAALLIPHLILPASAAAAAFAPSPYGPAREPPRPNPGPCRSSSFPLPSARTTTTTTTDADGRAALDLWWDEQSRRRPTGLDDVDCGRAPDPAATCGAGWGSRLAPGRRQRQIREEARAEAQREGNAFDAWWEGRADAGEGGGGGGRGEGGPLPSSAPPGPDAASVAEVLSEFAASSYARKMCGYCQVPPTDYGRIGGMLEYVRIEGGGRRIVLSLRRAFDEKGGAVLDRISRYLRARIPSIAEIHAVHGTGRDIY